MSDVEGTQSLVPEIESADYTFILPPKLDRPEIDTDDPGHDQSWAPIHFADRTVAEAHRNSNEPGFWADPVPILCTIPGGAVFRGPWFGDHLPEDEIGRLSKDAATDRMVDEMTGSPWIRVESWVDGDWPIWNIIQSADQRAHYSTAGRRVQEPFRFLMHAAYELEQEFRREFRESNLTITAAVVTAFWTCFQVQRRFKLLAREICDVCNCSEVKDARYTLLQQIERYLAGVREQTPNLSNRAIEEEMEVPAPKVVAFPLAELASTQDREATERAKRRSEWLDAKLQAKQPVWSHLDLQKHGGPTYNTTQRWLQGINSTRSAYVRGRLRDAFSCHIEEVPK